MNQEQEAGRQGRVGVSPKQKLHDAIQEYLDSIVEDNPEAADTGILTGWYLVTEEQDVVSGKSFNKRTVKDLQSINTTTGLIFYSDTYYRARIGHNVQG